VLLKSVEFSYLITANLTLTDHIDGRDVISMSLVVIKSVDFSA